MPYFRELQKIRQFILKWIDNLLNEIRRINLTELGNNVVGGPYRNFRPHNCPCAGLLSPDEEMEWHISHIKMCLTSPEEIEDFRKQFFSFVEKNSEQFDKKREEVIKKISELQFSRGFWLDYDEWFNPLFYSLDSNQLVEREMEITKKIEELSNWNQDDENLRKQWDEKNKFFREGAEFSGLISLILDSQNLATLEKNYQTVKNNFLYTTNKKSFGWSGDNNKTELDNYFKNKKIFLTSLQEQSDLGKKLNDLKNKFFKIYQKGKKYTFHELMTLWSITSEIEKEISLDGHLQEAKKELQIIQEKLSTYHTTIEYYRYI